jgi:hypothetical protein
MRIDKSNPIFRQSWPAPVSPSLVDSSSFIFRGDYCPMQFSFIAFHQALAMIVAPSGLAWVLSLPNWFVNNGPKSTKWQSTGLAAQAAENPDFMFVLRFGVLGILG